jgi:transcriptional regulator with XRE-family HTH domain
MSKEVDSSDETAEIEETYLRQVGSRIAERRIAKGWSQREVARRARMHPTRLSRIERGGVRPRLEELVALHGALGLGLDEMVFGVGSSAPAGELRELLETIPPEDREALLRILRTLISGYRLSRETSQQSHGGMSDVL